MNAFSAFTLPSGLHLKNRFMKAAMEENMAEANQLPGEALYTLYEAWAKGGVGTIITGNVMVDRLAMTGPGGIALEKDTDIAPFRVWAQSGKQNNTRMVMQINHPGRQVFQKMGGKVLSPSNVPLNMGKHSRLFEQPKAMTALEIEDLIARFKITAMKAQEAGFDGVQVHAAHGYLISQFLSPLTNHRDDQWGGDIKARAGVLLAVITGIKNACRSHFSVSVKLNSADFQRGGFSVEDAIEVVKMLNPLGLDFVELSGGSYESPAMQGKSGNDQKLAKTFAREAYFLSFAKEIAQHAEMPIMTTGGIKRLAIANEVLASKVTLAGMASALAYQPNLINIWQKQPEVLGTIPVTMWKDKTLSGLANMALVKRQLRRIGKGKSPLKDASALFSLIVDQIRAARLTKRYRQQYID